MQGWHANSWSDLFFEEHRVEIKYPKKGSTTTTITRAKILTLLERSQLTGWQRSHCDAMLSELAGNLSSKAPGKTICSQRSISWKVFCYSTIQRNVGGSLCMQRAAGYRALQKLGLALWAMGNKTLFLQQFLSNALYWQILLLCHLAKEKYLKDPFHFHRAGKKGISLDLRMNRWKLTYWYWPIVDIVLLSPLKPPWPYALSLTSTYKILSS